MVKCLYTLSLSLNCFSNPSESIVFFGDKSKWNLNLSIREPVYDRPISYRKSIMGLGTPLGVGGRVTSGGRLG